MLKNLKLRNATINDVPQIINLLLDDILGKNRENIQNLDSYTESFNEINQYDNIQLLVLENAQHEIIGTMQLIIIPCLANMGSKRLEIESVRISQNLRGHGIGSWMILEAINIAKKNNCKIVQLTTNKQRLEAHKFYATLGFIDTHVGMKLEI